MSRWSKLLLCGLVAVLVVVGVGGAVLWTKLPEIAAGTATKITGRTVRVGRLSLSPGRWIGVDLRDASIANLPGGTRPEMATVAHVTGEVALWPLLHGAVIARSVQVEKADVLLEKVGGQPNWRNGPKKPEQPGGGRSGFPTLLGLVVDGVVTFRTSSGAPLVTTLNGVALQTSAPDQPARLTGPGSYQGAPVTLDLKLGSFDQLHDESTPFPTDVSMTSGDTVLHFKGTMTDPLNVDGAEGLLNLAAPTPDPLEKMAGMDASPAPPVRIGGAFRHDHDLWRLTKIEGALGQAKMEAGTLQLNEGNKEKPDRIEVDLRFDKVDVDRLLPQFKGAGGSSSDGGESSFVPQEAPNPEISAKLEAGSLTYEKIEFTRPTLDVTLGPKLLKLDGISFGALGGQVRLNGQVAADEDGKTGALTTTFTATGLEVSALRQALGIGHMPLTGRMDIHAAAEGRAATAGAALRGGHASVVATMNAGSVSTQVVELASTDVAGLFRSSRSMTPLGCLLAVMEVRNGTAALGPVRLRSAAGTIQARGQVDLLRETVNLVVASERSTTGALALDVPVQVTGRLDDPSVAAAGSDAGRAALGARLPGDLPAALRSFAQRSECAR